MFKVQKIFFHITFLRKLQGNNPRKRKTWKLKIVDSTRKEISQDNSCAARARKQPIPLGREGAGKRGLSEECKVWLRAKKRLRIMIKLMSPSPQE